MGRRIVTGEEVRSLPAGSLLDLPPDAIVTDVAREWIEKRKIRVVDRPSPPVQPEPVQLAIGSDHAGYEMKESLAAYLREIGASFFDCGTHSKDAVDYPDFAHQVALAVALGRAKRGIVVDGAGIGSAMVANKVPGVRAAACSDETQARNAREHNDANVLTLGSRLIPLENVRKVVAVFLTADFTEPRHRARVAKIDAIEKKYYRPI
ncbi:MAG TPA: ribose 5-phosphate isomerase B [Vicinamibacteria bacterium]|nr:ribose 5-phosphate isomerase B [Vicinamibacteria bacterium]